MRLQRALNMVARPAKRPWRARGVPIPKSERIQSPRFECAGVYEQSLKHVLVSAHVRPPQPAGLAQMRTRVLEQFRAL